MLIHLIYIILRCQQYETINCSRYIKIKFVTLSQETPGEREEVQEAAIRLYAE